MARSSVGAVLDLVFGIGFKVRFGRAREGAVGAVADGAHPGGREAGFGGEETEGDFVLAGRLVDREAEMVGETVLDGAGEGLYAPLVLSW